jgi:hypothetical protein
LRIWTSSRLRERFAQIRRADFEGVALLPRHRGVEDLQNALASNARTEAETLQLLLIAAKLELIIPKAVCRGLKLAEPFAVALFAGFEAIAALL